MFHRLSTEPLTNICCLSYGERVCGWEGTASFFKKTCVGLFLKASRGCLTQCQEHGRCIY